ncbi:uncharacterized protein LOC144597079 [Rhinoraja longicauda]
MVSLEVLKELQVDEQMGELKLLGRKEFKLQLCKKNGNDFNGLDKKIAELQKRFFALHQEAVGLFTEHTLLTNPAYDPNDSEPQEQLIQHLKLAQQVLDNHRYEITAYDLATQTKNPGNTLDH